MHLGFATSAVVGLLLGLRFRVPALLVVSGLLLGTVIATGIAYGWPVAAIGGWAAGLLFTLQACYAIGVWLSTTAFLKRNSRLRQDTKNPERRGDQ